jgi:hypothetical protein
MEYSLKDNETGGVDLIRVEPEVVGTFHDRDVALKVLNLLLFPQKVGPEVLTPAPEKAPATQAFAAVRGGSEVSKKQPAAEKVGSASTPQLPVSAPRPVAVAEIKFDLDAAFARIRDGEKIADVAADVGTTMGSLRAKWANHQRYLKATVNRDNRTKCALCDKEFTPSAASPDKCARCARD